MTIKVGMLTGDAPLTALHVAKKTSICNPAKPALILCANPDIRTSCSAKCEVQWVPALGARADAKAASIAFEADAMPTLSASYDLLCTEESLWAAVSLSQGKVWKHVDRILVFARMSPQGKAKVIRMIQQFQADNSGVQHEHTSLVASKQVNFVLMCGDGGNDVGALKQADVGLALLGGYGSANAETKSSAVVAAAAHGAGKTAEDALNEQARVKKIKQAQAQKQFNAEFAVRQKEIMAKQQRLVEELVQQAAARGETGFMVQMNAVKTVVGSLKTEIIKEKELLGRKYNLALKSDADGKDPNTLALESLDDAGALPVVRPGDASIAAPFTSRTPSVSSVVQLIRQGRCTLLSALQQNQITMLESTISSYCLAALSLSGARSSERQMMVSGWLMMTASLAFSYATPIEKMHPIRPIRSLFHPAISISILGQALIHLYCMVQAINMAKEYMGEDLLKEVSTFNRLAAKGLAKQLEQQVPAEDVTALDSLAEVMSMWQAPFMPNLLNTVVFLVETSQIMAVLFVNYKGRPWMLGVVENHALFLSLFVSIGALVFAAWEFSPQMNRLIHLEPFPNDEFRWKIIFYVMCTIFGTFLWDRVVTAIFARPVFRAMLEQGFQTTPRDFFPIFGNLFKVIIFFIVLGTGNPIVWIGAYWANNKFKAWKEQQELESIAGQRS
jgi:cation-transporting ATPase 13A1